MQRKLIRTAAVLPVVVASALWTAHLTTPASAPVLPTAEVLPVPALPDGSLVPDREVGIPASISPPAEIRSATDGRFATVASRPAAGDIPAVALAAYQRAESLIGSADKRCHLPWQLLAAIGRVESDHGRFDGSSVDADGLSTPAIIGPVLDGARGTALVRDTDAGELDGDVDFDHAVGPLQFIPSTWAVVGVDGDGDGNRDPQDVDDAALAASVYLCSGPGDLATDAGLRAAIFNYNHSTAYVDQVVAIMDDYLAGNDITARASTVSAGLLVPLVPLAQQQAGGGRESGASRAPGASGASIVVHEPRSQDAAEPAPFGSSMQPTQPLPPTQPAAPVEPATTPPTEVPTEAPTEGPTDVPTEEPTEQPTDVPTEEPTEQPTGEATPEPTPSPTPTPTEPPTSDPTEPSAEAVELCTLEGHVDDPDAADDDFDECVTAYDDAARGPSDDPAEGPDPSPATDPRGQALARPTEQ